MRRRGVLRGRVVPVLVALATGAQAVALADAAVKAAVEARLTLERAELERERVKW